MKRIIVVMLALLVVLSINILSSTTSFASGGKGKGTTVSETVVVDLHPTPWTKDQIAAFQARFSRTRNSKNPDGLRHNEPPPIASLVSSCAAKPVEDNCTGWDPINEGCVPSASRVASKEVDISYASQLYTAGNAYLQYSTDCKSNWAKGISGYSYGCNGCTIEFTLSYVKVVRDDNVYKQYNPS